MAGKYQSMVFAVGITASTLSSLPAISPEKHDDEPIRILVTAPPNRRS
jgi:hypothetical protein